MIDDEIATVTTDNTHSDLPLIQIGSHEFKSKYLKKPTWCGICHEFIIGVTLAQQDSFKCIHCKLIGHHHCLINSKNHDCVKKKIEFSEVTNDAMKTFLGSSATKAGQTLQRINQYEIMGELGRGAFGKVYLVQDEEKVKYAMKSFPQNSKVPMNLRRGPQTASKNEIIHREIAIMKRLNHPNLVYLKEVIEDTGEGNKLYIVLEYIDGGIIMTSVDNSDPSLSPKFIAPRGVNGKYSEEQASRLFRQVLSGMSYLHGNKIVHRDLKPDNILVTLSGVVKLTDFGVSKDFADATTLSSKNGFVGDTQGTWPFWSPEMCDDDDDDDDDDEVRKYSALAADVWAAGVVLYILLFGKLPFWSDDMVVLFKRISAMKHGFCLEYPLDDVKSPSALQLLEAMLIGDPAKRPTFLECVEYEWVQQYSDADIERDLVEASSQVVSRAVGDDLSNAVTPGEALFISSAVKQKLSSTVAKLALRNSNRNLLKNIDENSVSPSTTSLDPSLTVSALSDKNRQYYDLNGHLYYQKFLKKMTWCTLCNSFVWGLTADQQQAFKCKKCSLTGHIECCKKFETICPCQDVDVSLLITPRGMKKRSSDFDIDMSERESIVTENTTMSDMTEDTFVDANNHEWVPKYLNRPTNCTICHQFIWGLTKKQQKAYKCRKCKIRGHRDCCMRHDELCSETESHQRSRSISTGNLTNSLNDVVDRGAGPGLVKLNQYQIIEEIGEVKSSEVFLAEDPSHSLFVVKKNHPLHGVSDMGAIHHEILILKRLQHPHIALFIEAIEEIHDPRQFYLVLEYIEGSMPIVTATNPVLSADSPSFFGSKADGSGYYTEREVSQIFRQILSGLVYLHANGIVHRDLKPHNILLTTTRKVKIVGFGTLGTDVISVARRRTIIPYLPPEITELGISQILQNSMFTFATDVWAAGVILYILLFGKLPFWSDDMVILFEKITARKCSSSALEYPIGDDEVIKTPSALQLLEAMLIGDPAKRPTFLECVEYEWVQQYSDADIERDLVEASSQIVSRDMSTDEQIVSRGLKMEKRRSLSQMLKSSMKDLSSPSSSNAHERHSMNLIEEYIQELPEESFNEDVILFHGHEWRRKYFNRPSWCTICGGFIAGVTKEMQNSYKCRKCKIYCHAACISSTANAAYLECEGCLDDTKNSSEHIG